MKIILLKDVAKLGKKYDTKDVSSGHALNLLIPQGLAIVATPDAVKRVSVEKAKHDGEKKLNDDLAAKNVVDLDGITLNIVGKANEKGHLFAGIHKEEVVAEILKQTQLRIDPTFIQLEHPVKEVGEHTVEARGAGKVVKFKVVVVGK